MTTKTRQRWIDKDNATAWAELTENPRQCRVVLARFYHNSGKPLNVCIVPSSYILSEFEKAKA